MTQNIRKKVGVYVAHDDDAILGVGGAIVQHTESGDDVYVVIFADGSASHQSLLGIVDSPSPQEVKAKRTQEIRNAMKILGVPTERLYFLELADAKGEMWGSQESTKRRIAEITEVEKPDVVYCNHLDAHADHRAVNMVVHAVLREWDARPRILQFSIWREGLLENRPRIGTSRAETLPADVLRVNVAGALQLKRRALFEMRSQVQVWPYPEWQIQSAPMLDSDFLEHFLGPEEMFIETKW